MNSLRTEAVSRYVAWAKLHSNARFNLAASGVLDYPLAKLPVQIVQIKDLEIGGTGPYGYELCGATETVRGGLERLEAALKTFR